MACYFGRSRFRVGAIDLELWNRVSGRSIGRWLNSIGRGILSGLLIDSL